MYHYYLDNRRGGETAGLATRAGQGGAHSCRTRCYRDLQPGIDMLFETNRQRFDDDLDLIVSNLILLSSLNEE